MIWLVIIFLIKQKSVSEKSSMKLHSKKLQDDNANSETEVPKERYKI